MHDLTDLSLAELTRCGRALREAASEAKTMEDAAEGVVRYLYQNLVDGDRGERACALVRFFKTHAFGDLDPELREFARGALDGDDLADDVRCMTLLATAGDLPEWNVRGESAGHRAIPLPSTAMVRRFPMISRLVEQLGIDIGDVVSPDPGLIADLEQRSFNVFYVPEARGSPYIVEQEGFVEAYGIRSVIGFGGVLPSGNLFVVILFTKTPVPSRARDAFRSLALSVKLAVLPYDPDAVFRSR